jgi:hypothetical protein
VPQQHQPLFLILRGGASRVVWRVWEQGLAFSLSAASSSALIRVRPSRSCFFAKHLLIKEVDPCAAP